VATLDLLTLQEAKLGLNEQNATGLDGKLPAWITAVSLRLDGLLGPIVRRTITAEQHDGGSGVIHLRHYPATSITTVTEYDDTTATLLVAETNAFKPADGYLVDPYPVPLTLADGTPVTLLSRRMHRRKSGKDSSFTSGRRNVEVTYVAGRFATTETVEERFKRAAVLTLQNLWQSQRNSTAMEGEFDVPVSNYPRFTIPNAVREMFPGELQDASTRFLVG
jgi:hypothetical protein